MTALFDTVTNMSVMSQKFFNSLPQKPKLLKPNAYTVTTARCTALGPIGKGYPTVRLGNKYFINKLMILQDLHRDLILGLNWQFNYKIGCIWNINEHQGMTHNNNY